MELDLSTNLLPLLPPWYREVEDYQQICKAEKAQFDRLSSGMQRVYQNFFVQTMDEEATRQWEKVFRIQARPSEETLEFRRQRVLSRLRTRPPFTLTFLHQQLNELFGEENWTCSIDYAKYALSIGAAVEKRPHRSELLYLVNKVKPAHISFRMFLYFNSERKPLYAATAVCGTSMSMTVRLPQIKPRGETS